MSIKLRHLASLSFLLFAACAENDLNVGNVDAGPDSPGTGGSSATGGATGGAAGGAGGAGGTIPDGATPTSCDPLAPSPKPISWASIIAGGRSATGTVYAVDQLADGVQRVYVSDASGTMVRQRVAGSGSGPGFYVFSVTDTSAPFVLQIDTSTATPRMGVLQGTLTDRKTFTIGQEGEELTVLPSATIAAMPVRNLPGTIVAEYVATVADGRLMLVTRPEDDWSYQDFRLFLGPPSAVTERPVASVTRLKDGGTTTILFDLDGLPATAYFPIVFADGGFAPGPATLTVGGVVTPLTRTTTAPDGATYLCFGGPSPVDAGPDGAGSGFDAGPAPGCNPLADDPKPIAWATILAGGRSSGGTIYAVDQTASSQRVFVSDSSGTLVRKRLAGSASQPGLAAFTVTDTATPFILEIDTAGASTRMGLLQGAISNVKTFIVGQEGEELTVLPNDSIAAMPVHNLPGTVVAEYIAAIRDGGMMLVTRPQDDWSYSDFRLFLGPADAVAERAVSSVTRARDGGSTTILFDLDGAQARADFPVLFADGGFAPGPATLTVGSTVTSLERKSTLPAGAVFVCL